jgi:hypothetical protein
MYPFNAKGPRSDRGPFHADQPGGRSVMMMVVMMMVLPMTHIGIAATPAALVPVLIGITRSEILAIGVRIELGTTARIIDHFLRFRRCDHGSCGKRRGA